MSSPAAMEAQVRAAPEIVDAVIAALQTEQGVHVETAVAALGRLAGSSLFRTFGLPIEGMEPGSPVFSDLADEHGPALVEVLGAGLNSLGVRSDAPPAEGANTEPAEPHLSFVESQRLLAGPVRAIGDRHALDDDGLARACALATALLIQRAGAILAPQAAYQVAVYGFVEGTKTVPPG
ncbi:MAG: hypothetical protein U0133_17760 [Gemmatimonadales bacterium]